MRVLCGKDAVGVGGNSGGNQREKDRGEKEFHKQAKFVNLA